MSENNWKRYGPVLLKWFCSGYEKRFFYRRALCYFTLSRFMIAIRQSKANESFITAQPKTLIRTLSTCLEAMPVGRLAAMIRAHPATTTLGTNYAWWRFEIFIPIHTPFPYIT
jgi:uncharacterized protein VirK/YbjX